MKSRECRQASILPRAQAVCTAIGSTNGNEQFDDVRSEIKAIRPSARPARLQARLRLVRPSQSNAVRDERSRLRLTPTALASRVEPVRDLLAKTHGIPREDPLDVERFVEPDEMSLGSCSSGTSIHFSRAAVTSRGL
jgi:hypothetical protein